MKDLLGQEVPAVRRQGDLLAGPCGLGVEAVCRTVGGVEYVRTPSGYLVRADGTGPLLAEKAPEGRDLPLLKPEKTGEISKSSQTPTG